MQAIISPGQIYGTVQIPASKSMMQRACAAALLHTGSTVIENPGRSKDDLAALHIIQQLGATVTNGHENCIHIASNGIAPAPHTINCGESGLSARLFTPIAALSSFPVHIIGSGSLLKRPMDVFATIFKTLQVSLTGFSGHLPYTVQGPLQAKAITIDGSLSSQFVSGLLFALSYATEKEITITVNNLKSKPYIDLTLDMLQQFGKPVQHDNYEQFYINPALFTYHDPVTVHIENDWSSAANWLVGGCIGGCVTLPGMKLNSGQADEQILKALALAKARITIDGDKITAREGTLQPFEFDAMHCPDLFPILAILAACCEGESYIHGIHRLFHKESNRAVSITEMLQQFEVPYSIEDDCLCINGVISLEGAKIDAYNDHRIAMAAAIGALRANDDVRIDSAEAVNKSYPDFYTHLIAAGCECTLK